MRGEEQGEEEQGEERGGTDRGSRLMRVKMRRRPKGRGKRSLACHFHDAIKQSVLIDLKRPSVVGRRTYIVSASSVSRISHKLDLERRYRRAHISKIPTFPPPNLPDIHLAAIAQLFRKQYPPQTEEAAWCPGGLVRAKTEGTDGDEEDGEDEEGGRAEEGEERARRRDAAVRATWTDPYADSNVSSPTKLVSLSTEEAKHSIARTYFR